MIVFTIVNQINVQFAVKCIKLQGVTVLRRDLGPGVRGGGYKLMR